MLKSWNESAPPIDTWVMASYGVMDKLRIVKTCKNGCCVYSPSSGNLILPSLWRLATEKEIEDATMQIEPYQQIDINELYFKD